MPYSNIDKPSKYFNTVTYTGTGASNSITGVGFQPDWVWIKGRSGATNHTLYDAVRGVQKDLAINTSGAETTEATGLTAFGTDGFTVGALAKLNTSSATYVAWNWLGANTTVSNTSGSITSTVSANTTSGFSVVSFTSPASGAFTVGHGLGVVPSMIILRGRGASSNAGVYHKNMNASPQSYYMQLNSTLVSTNNTSVWNNTMPTSTVFSSVGNVIVNASDTAIAYCFAEVKGYSKFGSYTGNGNADGTFVYTGFKPAMIILKDTANAYNWSIWDNKRNTYNVVQNILQPNSSDADTSGDSRFYLDFLSNGFKLRSNWVGFNTSSASYIYMAFAENPFVSSKGLPCTAR